MVTTAAGLPPYEPQADLSLPLYMTTSEVARAAGVSAVTVRKWHKENRIHAQRTASGLRLFKRGDVQAFIHARRKSDG